MRLSMKYHQNISEYIVFCINVISDYCLSDYIQQYSKTKMREENVWFYTRNKQVSIQL
jgi:hypothetical protein